MAEEQWTVERLQTELLNAEKSGRFTLEELTPLWEQAKEAIESEEHAVSLYTTYIYLTRRYLAKQGSNDYTKVDELFREASDFLVECFAEEYSEASARFEKNYAFFLYTKMKRPSQAREIWGRLLESESGPFAWLEAASLERAYGDVDFARRLFYKALDAVTFRPHEIYSAFVQFEREEGTREDLDRALEKINARVAELNTKSTQQQYFRQKQQQIGDNKQKQQPRKDNKGNRPQQKRAENGAAQADQRKPPFKKESAAGGERPTKGAQQQKRQQQQQQSRQKVVEAKPTRKGEERMEVAEEDEKATAGLFATSTVPLGPMIPGMSAPHNQPEPEAEEDKEMEDKEMVPQPPPATNAEKEEQPAAPSEEGRGTHQQLKRKRQTSSSSAEKAFPFNAGLEKNKLFVKQLHFGCKEAELKEFFTKFGKVTGVRIVTKWDGRSKGCAYVDFATDEEASNAIMGADGAVIRGKKIAVYLSNPPPKKPRLDQQADSGGCAVTAASVKRQDEGQGNSSSAPSAIQPKASTNKLSFAPRVLAGGQRSGRGSRLQMLPRSISKNTSNTLEQATTATNTFSPVGAVTHFTEEMNLGQNNMNKSEAEVNGGNSKN